MTNVKQGPERLELWEIGRLIPSARNARTHSEQQVAEIAGSIRAFGFMVPILVDKDGSIIAGHGRVLAARQLLLERIPVLVIDHLSEAEKRAYAIADNKIALNAGWDEELLKIELETLKKSGFEPMSLGFSEEEFTALIDQLTPPPIRNDNSIPSAPKIPVSQTGDIWQLGEHLLLCGSALDQANYSALLAGAPAAMVFAHPTCDLSQGEPGQCDGTGEDGAGIGLDSFLETSCKHMIANTTGALYVCTTPSQLHTLHSAFTEAGGEWSSWVIWGRNTFTLGPADFQRQFEPILYGWPKGLSPYWCGARDQGDLWMIDPLEANDFDPTMKPVELVERAVRNSSRRGDIVLDPFAGSGSTVIGCENTGRAARVMEREAQYCDVIISRWQKLTRKEAVHTETGRTLAQLAATRSIPELGK
jgi:DNA methylase/ParB/Sulfiredoxin domain